MHCSANVGAGARIGDLLRPVRHRQDDAVGRCLAHADRRRRAWLERERRLQFRRRLLRQGDQAVGGGRAGDLRHHAALRHGAGKRGARSRHPRARSRRRPPYRKHPRRLSDRFHPERQSTTGIAGHPQERHHADGGCVRRAAADRQAHAEPGDVSLPVRLHRQGGGHRKGPGQGAAADLLHLLRRALHAAPSRPNTAICCAT